MHVHPVGSIPRDPVIATTSMDRTVSLLTAIGLLMTGLLFVLLTIWLLNLERARPLSFGGGDMGIEFFSGTPSPPVTQAVTSPDDVTDDPSARLAASDWAELVQLMERISTVTDASLVDEPPGGEPGSGPGNGGATGELSSRRITPIPSVGCSRLMALRMSRNMLSFCSSFGLRWGRSTWRTSSLISTK